MINKSDLLEALARDCMPLDGTPFPQENEYAYLDESGDGDPVWTFDRGRMEVDVFALMSGKEKLMSEKEFDDKERMILFNIETILNNTVARCNEKQTVADVAFWTGIAYRECANFLRECREQMFGKRK